MKSMPFFRVFAAIAISGMALTAAPALAQGSGNLTSQTNLAADARIVKSIKIEDLKAIVAAEGHTLLGTGEFGPVSVYAKDADGLIYHLIGTVCEQPGVDGCLGIDMQVRYDADASATYEKLNDANLTYQAVKTSRGLNGSNVDTVFVSHYVILDGGQTMLNLRTILSNVLVLGPSVRDLIWGEN
jgi:hypothetical protein